MDLTKVQACNLVAELKNREGVDITEAELYQDVQIMVNGPAIVLVITD